MTEAGRLGIRRKEPKELIKEMFNRVAYATTPTEYDCALHEMRSFKLELALWVEKKEPERWAQSKFKKESGVGSTTILRRVGIIGCGSCGECLSPGLYWATCRRLE